MVVVGGGKVVKKKLMMQYGEQGKRKKGKGKKVSRYREIGGEPKPQHKDGIEADHSDDWGTDSDDGGREELRLNGLKANACCAK